MFWKFWLSILLLGGMYFLGKRSARREKTSTFSVNAPSRALIDFKSLHQNPFRTTAISLVISVVGLLGWFIYRDWQEAYQVMDVRVIQVQTGQVTMYQALKKQVQGRSFISLDGRRINLADVERLEVTPRTP